MQRRPGSYINNEGDLWATVGLCACATPLERRFQRHVSAPDAGGDNYRVYGLYLCRDGGRFRGFDVGERKCRPRNGHGPHLWSKTPPSGEQDPNGDVHKAFRGGGSPNTPGWGDYPICSVRKVLGHCARAKGDNVRGSSPSRGLKGPTANGCPQKTDAKR